MNRFLFISTLLTLFLALSLNLKAGVAPQMTSQALASMSNVPQSGSPEAKPKWQQRMGQKWKKFARSKAGKYLRAFILFALIGTGLYIAGVFIAAGTILTSVIATTALAEVIAYGLYVGAYVCYLYAFYAGIAAIVQFVLGSSGIS
ncbi:MAG: hypothetical protein AAF927_08290 [Bacteroidota bacterium]